MAVATAVAVESDHAAGAGPRPQLKGESTLSLRLMEMFRYQQVATTYGPEWRFFAPRAADSESGFSNGRPTLAGWFGIREQTAVGVPHACTRAWFGEMWRSLPLRLHRHACIVLNRDHIWPWTTTPSRRSHPLQSGSGWDWRNPLRRSDWSRRLGSMLSVAWRHLGSGPAQSDEPGLYHLMQAKVSSAPQRPTWRRVFPGSERLVCRTPHNFRSPAITLHLDRYGAYCFFALW